MFKRLYLKDREIKNLILMGDFLTETIFREERQDNIITRAEFEKRYENTVYKTETSLSEEMDIDPESMEEVNGRTGHNLCVGGEYGIDAL